MTDKVHLLQLICEMPGWQPHEQASSIERTLQELVNGGWIAPRLDGWEATHQALECYPNFYLGDEGEVRGEVTVAPPESDGSAPAGTVERSRMDTLVRAMLEVMPMSHVARLLRATPADLPEDELGWRVTRELIDSLPVTRSPAIASDSPNTSRA